MLNVENVQRVAKSLAIPVAQLFEVSVDLNATLTETAHLISLEETALLKHFKQIESKPDRQALVQVARRFAARR